MVGIRTLEYMFSVMAFGIFTECVCVYVLFYYYYYILKINYFIIIMDFFKMSENY